MPVLIVGKEKNFAALRPRLFSGPISTAAAREVSEAIAAANPDADLSALQPGTILTVPDSPHLSVRGDVSLDDTTITLKGRESDHDAFNVTLHSDHTYVIADNGDEAEEDGNWSYDRTSASTGLLTITPTGGGGAHTLDLKFANSTKGTFTGETAGGESVRGSFKVSTP